MLTSGKSGRSDASTSPMLISDRACCAELMPRPPPAGEPRGRPPGPEPSRLLAGVVDQAVLADLHLVAGHQRRLVDALAVDVAAVERSNVAHREPVARAHEL